jgi:hypothetical protein
MSDQTEELVHPHDLEPDPEPDEVPTAILEEDEDAPTAGMTLQTIAFGLGVFFIILLVLLLASGGSINLFKVFQRGNVSINTNAQLPQRLNNGAAITIGNGATGGSSTIDGLNTLPDYVAQIDPLFRDYWVSNGGEPIFGRPISPLLEENNRKFQWFERARLESWPEHAGTKYVVQPGRIGVEFTKGIAFPTQEFFVNRPGLQYEEVTQHGLRGAFLEFWQKNGGVDIFGYPISDEVQEILPEDESYHTVQYFERGRMELHQTDPNQPIKLGLLGTGLYKQDSKPNVEPIKPTPVPVTP